MLKGIPYEAAHDYALEIYEVSPYSLYHFEVIKSMPEEFGPEWFEFWGLER